MANSSKQLLFIRAETRLKFDEKPDENGPRRRRPRLLRRLLAPGARLHRARRRAVHRLRPPLRADARHPAEGPPEGSVRRLRSRCGADARRTLAAGGEARREVRAQCRRPQSAGRARGDRARVPRQGLEGDHRHRHRRLGAGAHRRVARRGRAARAHGHRRRHVGGARAACCSPTPISARSRSRDALSQGADIVLTGRVADAALTLGPLAHEFGWQWDDWDRMAAGLTLGHLLECSGQGSGGNFGSAGEWAKVPDYAHLGYPIAEVSEDGTALFTKAPGTGGRISFDTIRQQLLYEVHDPHAYFSPDVVLDMGTLKFDDQGGDRGAHQRRLGRGAAEDAENRRRLPGRLDGHGHDRLRLARGLCQVREERRNHRHAGDGARLGGRGDQRRIHRLRLAARRQRRPGLPRPAERMFPAHDHPHQGQARRRRLRPAVSRGSAFQARPTSGA